VEKGWAVELLKTAEVLAVEATAEERGRRAVRRRDEIRVLDRIERIAISCVMKNEVD